VAMQIPRLVVVGGFLALCATAAGAPSPDPYTASVAYAKCLRAHGVPHPLPDAKGNFSLTPAEEQRLRRVPRKTRKAAENACFHHLTALNLKPLSPQALARATVIVAELGRCIRGHGFTVGEPEVKNLSRGRAFFGFKAAPRPAYSSAKRQLLVRVQHECESRSTWRRGSPRSSTRTETTPAPASRAGRGTRSTGRGNRPTRACIRSRCNGAGGLRRPAFSAQSPW